MCFARESVSHFYLTHDLPPWALFFREATTCSNHNSEHDSVTTVKSEAVVLFTSDCGPQKIITTDCLNDPYLTHVGVSILQMRLLRPSKS